MGKIILAHYKVKSQGWAGAGPGPVNFVRAGPGLGRYNSGRAGAGPGLGPDVVALCEPY